MFSQLLTLALVKPDYDFRNYGSLAPDSTRAVPREISLQREATEAKETVRPAGAVTSS